MYSEEETTISIPYNFEPRWYQAEAMAALDDGYKRLVLVWHRRAGKDLACLAGLVVPAMRDRVGYYLYVYPTSTLGKRAMWRGMDNDGMKFMDRIPKQLVRKKYEAEMLVEMDNGSLLQIIGSDKIENVGINPVGIVMSEYSLQMPTTWDYLRPILRFNDGWAIFNYTPRGKNHGYTLYEMAKYNPKWFVQRLTINDTELLTDEDLNEERREGMSEEMIQQEYYCSFDKGIEGTYYGKEIDRLELEGRVGFYPYEQDMPVHVTFDLGMNDFNALIFWQVCGREVRYIDYYQNHNQGLEFYALYMRNKPYIYGDIWFPHDGKVRELGTGISRARRFEDLINIAVRIVPDVGLLTGIEYGRKLFHRLFIDDIHCCRPRQDATGVEKDSLLDCLRNYQKEWDDKREEYKDFPRKSKFNHGADTHRYVAIVVEKELVTSNNNSNVSEIVELNRLHRKRII